MSEELDLACELRDRADHLEHAGWLEVVRELRAAADLIESQQARIEELEAVVVDVADGLRLAETGGDVEEERQRLLKAAASPDTPETRP